MNNPILIIGHAALPENLCNAIIEMHEVAPFTELKSMNEEHGGHFAPLHEEDEDRVKFTNEQGRESYTILSSNPDFMQILEWVDEFVPWGDDFEMVSYMQILKYPMESFCPFHKDESDEGDTGTVIFNLNEDFTGGNLTVDGHKIIPFTGSMVAFNNSTERWHGVDPVLTGERYVLSMWFAPHKEESMTEYDTLGDAPTHPKTQIKL